MSVLRIRLTFTVLLIALLLSGCQKTSLIVPGENIVTIKQNATKGCTITIANPQVLSSPKDPLVHVGYFSSTLEQLTLHSADNQYQVSFPAGSPLDAGSPLTILSGATQSYPISFLSRLKAQFSDGTYQFDVYDAAQQKCDPIVHVTK